MRRADRRTFLMHSFWRWKMQADSPINRWFSDRQKEAKLYTTHVSPDEMFKTIDRFLGEDWKNHLAPFFCLSVLQKCEWPGWNPGGSVKTRVLVPPFAAMVDIVERTWASKMELWEVSDLFVLYKGSVDWCYKNSPRSGQRGLYHLVGMLEGNVSWSQFYHTIFLMEIKEFMNCRLFLDNLFICFPTRRGSSHPRPGEVSQWVEEDIVYNST